MRLEVYGPVAIELTGRQLMDTWPSLDSKTAGPASMLSRSRGPVCALHRAHLDPARRATTAMAVPWIVDWPQPMGELDQHLT
jgi:hypothetical protein